MTTIHQLLQQAAFELASSSETPLLDAEILLAHVLQQSRLKLRLLAETEISIELQSQFQQLIKRRLKREPVAYLVGVKEFWSLELEVNRHTLVPRPETELLVETALLFGDKDSVLKVADLGTGSGAIALALASERPHWQIDAVDISQNAIHLASKNAQRLGLTHISFYTGNWFTALLTEKYDLVVSNPPYLSETEWPAYAASLAHEPKQALVSGQDGLDAVREIAKTAFPRLMQAGSLLLEHGHQQGEQVRAILVQNGYQRVRTLLDLAGRERVTMGAKSP